MSVLQDSVWQQGGLHVDKFGISWDHTINKALMMA